MTLAEYRRRQGAEAAEAAEHAGHGAVAGERAHPSPLEYVQIGLALAVITAIEVAVYYLDLGTTLLVGILLALSAIKFSLVVLWFMHLRFDNRVFSMFFVGGLALAFAIFMVVLASLGAGLI